MLSWAYHKLSHRSGPNAGSVEVEGPGHRVKAGELDRWWGRQLRSWQRQAGLQQHRVFLVLELQGVQTFLEGRGLLLDRRQLGCRGARQGWANAW